MDRLPIFSLHKHVHQYLQPQCSINAFHATAKRNITLAQLQQQFEVN